MIKFLFLGRHFFWQLVYYIKLFFNYAFLIGFVDVLAACGCRTLAKLLKEAWPGRGVLTDHWVETHVGGGVGSRSSRLSDSFFPLVILRSSWHIVCVHSLLL